MNGPRTEAVWISAHIHFHDDLDDLLVRTVRPLVRDLRADGSVTRWFFLRYWNGGPHLRLRLLVPAEQERRVRAAVAERVRLRLRDAPAGTTLTEARYAEQAREFADWERSAVRPLAPNNSLAFVPYRPEHHRYGTGETLADVEQHFTESSTLALRLLASGPTRSQRLTLALSAVAAVHAQRPDGPAVGSDLPPPVFPRPLPAELRAEFDADYERRRAFLVESVRRFRSPAGGPAVERLSPGEGAWWGITARLRDRLSRSPDVRTGLPLSPTRVDVLLDACAHLFCNRLGLSLVDELHARHLMGRATADLPAPSRTGAVTS